MVWEVIVQSFSPNGPRVPDLQKFEVEFNVLSTYVRMYVPINSQHKVGKSYEAEIWDLGSHYRGDDGILIPNPPDQYLRLHSYITPLAGISNDL